MATLPLVLRAAPLLSLPKMRLDIGFDVQGAGRSGPAEAYPYVQPAALGRRRCGHTKKPGTKPGVNSIAKHCSHPLSPVNGHR